MSLDLDLVQAALPGYEIGSEIGRGGWGVVLQGAHRALGRRVAVKQLPRAFGSDGVARERFIEEARILSSMDHPHIVPVYDFVEHDGVHLIVMELLEGGTLWDRFTTTGLRSHAACAVILAVCTALDSAHGVGILHRDLKPENVLFNAKGVPKLSDFGLAKVLGGASRLTMAGEVLGTPAYMSPEQALGRPLGPPSEIYSLGVMLYELLAGRLPFADEDPVVLLNKHATAAPEPIMQLVDTTEPLATLVMRALEKDASRRHASAEAFGVALAEASIRSYGSSWLQESGVPLLGGGPIVDAAHREPPAGAGGAQPGICRPTTLRHHLRLGALTTASSVVSRARGVDAGTGTGEAPGSPEVVSSVARRLAGALRGDLLGAVRRAIPRPSVRHDDAIPEVNAAPPAPPAPPV